MNFLDRLTKVAEEVAQKVEKASKAATDIYKKDGVEGLLSQADKALDKVGERAAKMGEKTTEYFKDIQEKNKSVVKEVNKKTTDDLESKINVGVATTVNTVNVLTEDLIKMGKKVFNSISDNQTQTELKEKTTSNQKVQADPKLDHRYDELNKLPLKSILKFIGAKQTKAEVEFQDKSGNTFLLFEKNWYSPTKSKGGEGAISLFSYHLSLFKSVDYENEKNALMNEAINILEQLSLGHHIKDEPKVEVASKNKTKIKKEDPAVKVPAKKMAKKSVKEIVPEKKVTRKSKP